MNKVKILLAALSILVLLAFTPVLQTQRFQRLITKTLTVTNDTTLQKALTVDSGGITITAGGVTIVAGGATITSGGLTVNGGLTTLSGGLNFTPQTEVVTTAFVITPTSGIVSLTSTIEVTSSTTTGIITTTATNGDIIILANNNASDRIWIDGVGGTVECKADVILGASDTLWLWYNETDLVWNCLSNFDNS